MIHRSCKHNVVLDLSQMYSLRSPGILINTKGVNPSMVEITTLKKASPVIYCDECDETFSNKEEFEEELLDKCCVCSENFRPSQLLVTDYIPLICNSCLKSGNKNSSSPEHKYLNLYSEILQREEHPTLLTIMLKKL